MIRPYYKLASSLPRLSSIRSTGGLPSRYSSIMSSERAKLSHEERTSSETRQQGLHFVKIAMIEEVNPDIRLLKLSVQDRENGLKFLPGQWLDVFIPGIPKAGGFTITSTPSLAQPNPPHSIYPATVAVPLPPTVSPPLIELAVQRSSNPPAQWIWRAREEDRTELAVRVGGSFVWPPPPPVQTPKNVLFVAGGVGINPLISILTHLFHETDAFSGMRVRFVYATKAPANGAVLFLDRLLRMADLAPFAFELTLCLTGQAEHVQRVEQTVRENARAANVCVVRRRMVGGDVLPFLGAGREAHADGAVGSVEPGVLEERRRTVAYVCGPQQMTDEYVEFLSGIEGLGKERVFCEKWW